MNLREIDLLVAEKVMGWEEVKENDFIKRPDVDFIGKAPDRFCEDAWSILPNYSTDISDVWEVVENFKDKGFLFTLKNTVGGEYTFSLTDWNGMCSTYTASSVTAPLAICLAALKAVGVEVNTK
jgi:Phage ABA sandwich domain